MTYREGRQLLDNISECGFSATIGLRDTKLVEIRDVEEVIHKYIYNQHKEKKGNKHEQF